MKDDMIYNINLLQLECRKYTTIHDYLRGVNKMKVQDIEQILQDLQLAHGRIDQLEKWFEDNKIIQPKYHSVALITLYAIVAIYIIIRMIYVW